MPRQIKLNDLRDRFSLCVREVAKGASLDIMMGKRRMAVLTPVFGGVAPTREMTEVQASRQLRSLVEAMPGTDTVVRIDVLGHQAVDLKAVPA